MFERFERYLFYVGLTNQPAADRIELAAFRADSVLHRVLPSAQAGKDFKFLASREVESSSMSWPSRLPRLLQAVAVWHPCRKNDECVIVSGVCGGWEAVPRAFEADLIQRIQNINAEIDCMSRTMPKPLAVCLEGTCVTGSHEVTQSAP